MSRLKITIRLTIACFVTGTLLWVLSKTDARNVITGARHSSVFDRRLNDVTDIVIAPRNASPINMRLTSDGWRMFSPSPARVSKESIQQLLDTLEAAPIFENIDSDELSLRELTPGSFGLNTPLANIKVSGTHFTTELLIGDTTATSNKLFTSIKNTGAVLVTYTNIIPFLTAPLEFYADTRLFYSDPRKVNTIVFRRPDREHIKLAREKNTWIITQPINARADWQTIDNVFTTLTSARALRIITSGDDLSLSDAAAKGGDGLSELEAAQIQLFSNDAPGGETITLGARTPNNTNQVFAIFGNGVTGIVPDEIRRIALIDVNSLRDLRLFPLVLNAQIMSISLSRGMKTLSLNYSPDGEWLVTTPVAVKADSEMVSKLISSIFSLSAYDCVITSTTAQYGLTATDDATDVGLSMKIHTASGNYDLAMKLDDARTLATSQTVYAAEFAGSDTTFFIHENETVSNLFAALSSPASLLDKTIMQLSEDQVGRITVLRDGKVTNQLERVKNEWLSVDRRAVVDADAVNRLFDCVKTLRAESVAAIDSDAFEATQGTRDKSPTVEITFDLTDAISLRRVLSVFAASDDESRAYAVIKGHNTFFEISKKAADVLSHPLLSPFSGFNGQGTQPLAPAQTVFEEKDAKQ